MNASQNAIVHFSVYAMTNYGEIVVIVGNCQELGQWDTKKALKLQTNSKEYPIWFCKNPLVFPKFTNIQYKICIVDKNNLIVRWENLKQNRILFLKNNCSIFFTEGENKIQYGFQHFDSNSTHFNSTKKASLCSIQEDSDDDNSVSDRKISQFEAFEDKRKRSSSFKERNWIEAEKQNNLNNNTTKFEVIKND